jgi:DNA-binding transcriptional LysR family regulator
VDGSDAMRTATVLGIGIAQTGSESTAALLASGDLVTVIDASAPPWAVCMVRAPGQAGSALAAVMEAFVAAFRQKGKS